MNKRLTRKINDRYFCAKQADEFDGSEFIEANQKLGQLEDIEDELGIDLVTLFKALKQGGVYVKERFAGDTKIKMHSFEICGDSNGISIWSQVRLNAKDYGKTWALTKEELLND